MYTDRMLINFKWIHIITQHNKTISKAVLDGLELLVFVLFSVYAVNMFIYI